MCGAGGRQVVVVKPSETRNLLLGRRRRVECGNTRQVSASGTGDTAHPSMIPSSEHETWNHEGSKFSLRILSSGPPCRSLAACSSGGRQPRSAGYDERCLLPSLQSAQWVNILTHMLSLKTYHFIMRTFKLLQTPS